MNFLFTTLTLWYIFLFDNDNNNDNKKKIFVCCYFVDDNVSEHGEACTVCGNDGTLILCEDCPRSYHVECCYPPLRKVPRGKWMCQICTGLDADLPYRRRAATLEKKRGM